MKRVGESGETPLALAFNYPQLVPLEKIKIIENNIFSCYSY